jgi:alkylated DNA nucleotide flippase Atl1
MTRAERAQQVWQVLVSAAHNRQVLTYEILAKEIGLKAYTLARPLGCVMKYCEKNDLPALTVLVVSKGRGTPSSGLETVKPSDQDREREKVFATPWFSRLAPSAAEFDSVGDGF